MRPDDATDKGFCNKTEAPPYEEVHYTLAEIAQKWKLSIDKVRRIFEKEPGTIVLPSAVAGPRKRRYTTLRIPAHVVERVHRRLSKV